MITEWQPIIPKDKRVLDKRKIYELLRADKVTFVLVGEGEEVFWDTFNMPSTPPFVAWREFDCAGDRPVILASELKKGRG